MSTKTTNFTASAIGKKKQKTFRENDSLHKRHPILYEELKNKNRERMQLSRAFKKQSKFVSPQDEKPQKSSLSTKQARYRSIKGAEENLPKSPNKRLKLLVLMRKNTK